jgi:uncharacterized membrane protein (UPF0127 family)
MNKIIIAIGIIFAIVIAFILIQFNPFTKNTRKNVPTVTVKNQTFSVTVANTEEERQQGLSGTQSLPLTEGKLFLFDSPDTYAFWMKGMKFPLDIIFINDSKIVSIAQNLPPATTDNPPTYQPTGPSNAALEINAGLAKKYNFKPGDKVVIFIPTPSPSPAKK